MTSRLLAAALLLAAADAALVGPARCAASRVATPRMGSTADFKTGLTILMGWCMHAHTESAGESKREERAGWHAGC